MRGGETEKKRAPSPAKISLIHLAAPDHEHAAGVDVERLDEVMGLGEAGRAIHVTFRFGAGSVSPSRPCGRSADEST